MYGEEARKLYHGGGPQHGERGAGRGRPLTVALVGPYELGRQPFGLAHPARALADAGFEVRMFDLSQRRVEPGELADVDLVAVHLAMHTATRLALAWLGKVRAACPDVALCVYGLYAGPNRSRFEALGVRYVLEGPPGEGLTRIARQLAGAGDAPPAAAAWREERFGVPMREGLPPLERYARLVLPGGEERTMGFLESTIGCRHLCRHCPVVPAFGGRFRAIPLPVVLADASQQVAAGARHLSFGDPDFLNGPTHALRVVQAIRARHPEVTFDATIKVEHLLRHRDLLPTLRACGLVLVTSAFESFDDRTLTLLEKGHRAADLEETVRLLARNDIALAPTFVPFTPWVDARGYVDTLLSVARLGLIPTVSPVQLTLRLLIPAGSRLLELRELAPFLGPFDEEGLGYRWTHPDPRLDLLQEELAGVASQGEEEGAPRAAIFEALWERTARRLPEAVRELGADGLREVGRAIERAATAPSGLRHSEPWYCCAEPTAGQLAAL